MEESKISNRLIELGVPGHLWGFDCIIKSCQLIAENPRAYKARAPYLFERVADAVGLTSHKTVEKDIRYAISRIDIDAFPRCKRMNNMQFLYWLYYTLK